jgi:oligopeptide/dipeptide ABC transporter ATP-binding protein
MGLLSSIPRLDGGGAKRLTPIRGAPPEPIGVAKSCRFAPRCTFAADICRQSPPPRRPVGPGHHAACHFDVGAGSAAA